mgnify:FL=1
MRVNIYSLQKTLFEGEAVSVNCQTEAGEITVLDRHAPLISVLRPGIITVVDTTGKAHYIQGSGGFLEFGAKNQATAVIQEP